MKRNKSLTAEKSWLSANLVLIICSAYKATVLLIKNAEWTGSYYRGWNHFLYSSNKIFQTILSIFLKNIFLQKDTYSFLLLLRDVYAIDHNFFSVQSIEIKKKIIKHQSKSES